MSSFYDETSRILWWGRERWLEPAALAGILERRLDQARAHWEWCAKRSAVARRVVATELNDRSRMPWLLFHDALKAADVKADGDFFQVFVGVVAVMRSLSPDELYGPDAHRPALLDFYSEVFDALHDAGHRLATETQARYSDNPYPMGRRSVPNSDAWLRQTYPDHPWGR